MKIAMVICSGDPETVWNAFRLGTAARKAGDQVDVFLLGNGVTAESISTDTFPVVTAMRDFQACGGEVLASGNCLRRRAQPGSDQCPASTVNDLYALVRGADRVLSF